MSSKLTALRDELSVAARAHQTAVDALDDAVAGYLRVNRTDLRCLDVLGQLGEAVPSQLGAALGLTTGSVTAMLDRLARQGYLTREPHPVDRRKVVVRPTELIARLAGEAYGPLAEEGERDVLSRYTAAELRVITDFLRVGGELQDRHTARIRALPR